MRLSPIIFRVEPAIPQFRNGSVENICGRVDAGLTGVLYHPDDKSDADHLHGNVARYPKQAARQGN